MANIPLIFQKKWILFYKNGLLNDCTYKSVTSDGYNTSTGIVNPGSTVDYELKNEKGVILDEFNQTINQSQIKSNDDVEILSIDRKALFPVLNLAATPKIDDILLIDSIEWIVKGISIDPAKAVYTLHIRPIK